MITGIVVALPDELGTLTTKKVSKGHSLFIADAILVVCSGVGPDNARAAAELLVAKGATQLISWGCAAALSPQLKAGDLTLADKLLDADYNELPLDPHWTSCAKALLAAAIMPVVSGCLVESTSIIATGRQKKQIHSITDAIVLDMESAAVAKIANRHGLPFLAIRAIVDPANMDLPRAIAFAANEHGDIVLSKLLLFLLLHPLELPQLIRLGINFKAATKTLTQVASHLHKLAALPHG